MITNEDNMDLMARYEDKHFDLAIVDPPYGIGEDGRKSMRTLPNRPNSYTRKRKYEPKFWDNKSPGKKYFFELIRVSKNQIIFGSNHFIEKIPNANSSCWIVWDKKNEGSDFADCELAWSSFKTSVRKYRVHKFHNTKGGKDCIHPTQKPVKLYEWLLKNYAKEGDKILDTHLGSGSIAIAVDRMNKIEGMNLTLTACELDEDYYKAAMKRINEQTSQTAIPL